MHLACTVDLKMGIYFDLIGTDNVADDKQLLAVLDLCSLLHIRNWGSSKCQQYYLQSFRAINKCRVAGNNLTNVNYILLTLMCNLNQMLVIPQRQTVPKERERERKRGKWECKNNNKIKNPWLCFISLLKTFFISGFRSSTQSTGKR